MIAKAAFLALIALCAVSAIPVNPSEGVLFDSEKQILKSEPALPNGWFSVYRARPTDLARITIVVRSPSASILPGIVAAVSDPKSFRYGRHLTRGEIEELTAPRAESMAIVRSWLQASKVEFTEEAGQGAFLLDIPVPQAEALLKTKFSLVSHTDGRTALRAAAYSIPEAVHEQVSAIYGLHGLPLPRKVLYTSTGAAEVKVTPSLIANTYGVSGVTVQRSTQNRQAVAEFQGELMNKTHLSTFFSKYVPKFEAGDDQVFKFVHDKGFGDGLEAELDIQYIMGVAPGIKTEFWEWKANDFCHDLKRWTATMMKLDDIPFVHSISYGWQGDLTEIGCLDEYVQDVDTDFQKLAARGISIIFASGDSGSGYTPNANAGKYVLWPSWPASSPYVTAVGATRFINQKQADGEMATDQFGSGGGFSSMFDQPSWQSDAVSHFLNTATLPPSTTFPATGRATPDVAGLGQGFQVIDDEGVEDVGGTSASAPLFAGLVSLLNDARIAQKKAPLGFLNPFLYQNADSFTDIVKGTNKIGRDGESLKYGFDCAAGWDPATGLGTPVFPKLLQAALNA